MCSRRDNDLNVIMDMAEFYKKNENLCVSDITSNDYTLNYTMM